MTSAYAQDSDHGGASLKGLNRVKISVIIDPYEGSASLSQADIEKLVKTTIDSQLNTPTSRLATDGPNDGPIFKVRIKLVKRQADTKNPNVYGYTFAVVTSLYQAILIPTAPAMVTGTTLTLPGNSIQTRADTWRIDAFDIGRPNDVPARVNTMITTEIQQFVLEYLKNQ
jgi:hypothetical protein